MMKGIFMNDSVFYILVVVKLAEFWEQAIKAYQESCFECGVAVLQAAVALPTS